jgi:hypothetical protein
MNDTIQRRCVDGRPCETEVLSRLRAADKAREVGLGDHPAVKVLRDKAAAFADAHGHGAYRGEP